METGNNTDTIIFGAPPKEDSQVQEAKTIAEQPKETVTDKTEAPSTEAKPKEEPNQEQKPTEPKGDEKEDGKKKEVDKPTFKVNYPETTSKKEDAPKEEQKKDGEAHTVSEKEVLSFLEKSGIKVEKLSDLSQKQTLDEEVEKFRKFKEETNRGLSDFYNSQRDWSKESKETRIKEYLKWTNPNLSEEDVATKLELLSVSEEDKETMTEKEIKKAMLDFNELDAKALGFLTQKSKEYSLPKQSPQAQAQQQPTAEEIAKAHRPYWEARDGSLKELNEISFTIDGIGEIKLPVDDDDKISVGKNTQTVDDFIGRWRNKDGFDTRGLVEDTLWSQKESREKLIQAMAEQIHALTLDTFSKQNRNVNLNDAPKETEKTRQSGLIVDGAGANEKFGKPIFG